METLISKVASNGKRVEIEADEKRHFVILINGQKHGSADIINPLGKSQGEITHWIGPSTGAVGLTTAEATILRDYQRTPTQEPTLRDQRRDLIARIQGCYDEAQAAKNHEMDSGQAGGAGWRKAKEWEIKAETITGELKAFDVAHPEVLAGIEVERAESIKRHQWD
jgi:hypothetical protein